MKMIKTVFKFPDKYYYRLTQTEFYNIPVALNTERIIRICLIERQGSHIVKMSYQGEGNHDVLFFSQDSFTDVVKFFNNEPTSSQLEYVERELKRLFPERFKE